MPFSSKTVPDLSSNVLKLSFMRPSLKAVEKAKIAQEDKNKLNITFNLPEKVLNFIHDSLKDVKNPNFKPVQKSLLVHNRLPRGVRWSFGGFNLETEKQMARGEINNDGYEDINDPTEDYSVSVEEMKEFALKNRKKFNKYRHNNEIEDGEIVSEHKSKKRRI